MKKKALITGGARPDGIGWATARSLVEHGYEVIVTGGNQHEVSAADRNAHIRVEVLDVRDNDAIQNLFASLDRLDALVNCAGTADPTTEFTPEGFAQTVDINLNGTHRCCIAAKEMLAQSKGAIVNVGSIYSLFGNGDIPGYSASKGAIVQLTQSLALAWGPDIRVNAVAPGWIKTGMARPVWENEEWGAALFHRTPLGRFGEPEELAGPIRFLLSAEASFISGVLLTVDGGYSTHG